MVGITYFSVDKTLRIRRQSVTATRYTTYGRQEIQRRNIIRLYVSFWRITAQESLDPAATTLLIWIMAKLNWSIMPVSKDVTVTAGAEDVDELVVLVLEGVDDEDDEVVEDEDDVEVDVVVGVVEWVVVVVL